MTSKTPGPGTYEIKHVNSDGKTVLSTDAPIRGQTFNPPNKNSKRVIAFDFTKDTPGPGMYTPSQKATEMSKNMKGYNYRLYQFDRKIELHDKTKRDFPGPGTYRVPSDFGYVAN